MKKTLSVFFLYCLISCSSYRSPFRSGATFKFKSLKAEEESSGLSLKVVGALGILTFGIFGSGVIGSLNNVIKGDILVDSTSQSPSSKLKTSADSRGSLTRLSRWEWIDINQNYCVIYLHAIQIYTHAYTQIQKHNSTHTCIHTCTYIHIYT